MKIITLEESFWYEKLATEGSTVAHVRVKSAVAADWQRMEAGQEGGLGIRAPAAPSSLGRTASPRA